MIRKVPQESEDYVENSEYVLGQILMVMREAVKTQKNRVALNTNLKRGLRFQIVTTIVRPKETSVLYYQTYSNPPNRSISR